ncbi:MAG TPA: MBL fold metallo-hydrolase [Ktedonobacteraceae bacterium]|nr:MBL fold metallo-hydrolase [Ktedonobacteraceae bacterium]
MDTALSQEQLTPRMPQPDRQVHTITDRFSIANTYLIDDGRLIVVDPGSPLNVHLLLDYLLHYLHRSPEEIDLIVLTHLHQDHISGMGALRKRTNAPVAASSVTRQLADLERQNSRGLPNMNHLAEQVFPHMLSPFDLFAPHYQQHLNQIDIWLDDVMGLPGHPNWRVVACPAHTPESLCLYNPFSFELISGDTILTFDRREPIVRANARANRSELREVISTLRNLNINYVYPGHGKPILAKHGLAHLQME